MVSDFSSFEEVMMEGKILRERLIKKVGSEDGQWVSPGITKVGEEFKLCVVLQSVHMANVQAVRSALDQVLQERNVERRSAGEDEVSIARILDIGEVLA